MLRIKETRNRRLQTHARSGSAILIYNAKHTLNGQRESLLSKQDQFARLRQNIDRITMRLSKAVKAKDHGRIQKLAALLSHKQAQAQLIAEDIAKKGGG